MAINREMNRLFTTNEDFSRVDPTVKRLCVVGCTGAGKSTLLNKMGGWKMKWVPKSDDPEDEDGEMKWQAQDGIEPIFESGYGVGSVTQFTTYANLSWLGQKDDSHRFVAIDTPGHDDPAATKLDEKESREKIAEQARLIPNLFPVACLTILSTRMDVLLRARMREGSNGMNTGGGPADEAEEHVLGQRDPGHPQRRLL